MIDYNKIKSLDSIKRHNHDAREVRLIILNNKLLFDSLMAKARHMAKAIEKEGHQLDDPISIQALYMCGCVRLVQSAMGLSDIEGCPLHLTSAEQRITAGFLLYERIKIMEEEKNMASK